MHRNRIALFEVSRRVAGAADARRSPCENQISRIQCHHRRDIGDNFFHLKNKEFRIGRLDYLSIYSRRYVQTIGVADLILGY